MNKVYVLGGAQTDFERNWSREGKNAVAMLREVVSDGCTAAGISYNEIVELNKESKVACFIGNFLSELYNQQSHIGALMTEVDPAFYGVPSVRCEAACAAGAAAMDLAMAKIASGQIDVAIVVGWALTNTVNEAQASSFLAHTAYQEKESVGDNAVLTNQYGRLLDAYLAKYNVPEDEVMASLAHLTEVAYENGKRNPLSQTRKMFMSEKQANMRGCSTNPLTAGKLAKADATMVTDGAAV
ncbi:MAG: beta-ketoacyl synthase N-terminal-like domain-containing protein, partial [Butyricicoccaceae bacterium]